MRTPNVTTVLAAVLVPVLFAGYLYGMGYDQLFTDVVNTTRPGPAKYLGLLVGFVLPLSVVGAVETAGFRRGLRLPAVAATLGFGAIPWVADVSPGFAALTSFGTEIAVATAGVLAIAVVEYVVRVRMDVLPPGGGAAGE